MNFDIYKMKYESGEITQITTDTLFEQAPVFVEVLKQFKTTPYPPLKGGIEGTHLHHCKNHSHQCEQNHKVKRIDKPKL